MAHRTDREWQELATAVVLDVLATCHAVTTRELEARAADRTWNPMVCPAPIQPHLLTTAVAKLVDNRIVERTTTTTRGGRASAGAEVTTLSLQQPPVPKRVIESAAARKRLLTSRHNGWATRQLIGPAGEHAMTTALRAAGHFADVRQNVTALLGTVLVGEVDCSCVYVDTDLDLKPVLVLIEVKNTREWYYADTIGQDGPLRRLLRKAAALQMAHPDVLIAPMFVLRKAHITLVRAGEQHGFLVASTAAQLVRSDGKLSREHFNEVRDELGYQDLQLDTTTTNHHRGIASKMIPNKARATAERWASTHREYVDVDDLLY